ncbi:MAG: response regulator [Nannocystaceae bacterium]|nr:response regulator [Myxococcales bacterium]
MKTEPKSAEPRAVVLIVDDTPTNLEVLQQTLSDDGFKVLVAIDGEGALEQAEYTQPDLILLDVMMPELDGFETCRRLKASSETRDIPVIFMTALSETVDKVRGFELGAVDYITKPFQQKEVSVRVATHVTLRKLQQQLQRANEWLDERVIERTVDLAETNARLRTEIRTREQAQAQLEATNAALSRFVPREFLRLLSRDSVIDVGLGDFVERDATIMFAGIRGFGRRSEVTRPERRLSFLNNYLQRIAPIIREHAGFIDRYTGDAFMALFPESAHDAVAAADAIHREVVRFNSEQTGATEPMTIGVGLHHGSVLLAVIGESERLESAVISEIVDCAALLERLTKRFLVDTLASEPMLRTLPETDLHNSRAIGTVRFANATEPMTVYELFSSNSKSQRDLKHKTRKIFEDALESYNSSALEDARRGLEEVLNKNPGDLVAQRLLRRTRHFIGHGVPAGWSGVYEIPRL